MILWLIDISIQYIIRLLRQLFSHGKRIFTMEEAGAATGLLAEQIQPHPFTISAYLIQPSAISHWSALQYHGLTEQVPQVVTASTPIKVVTPSMREKQQASRKSKHAWEIDGVRYEYVTVQHKHFYGMEKIWLDEDFQVSITDKERTQRE